MTAIDRLNQVDRLDLLAIEIDVATPLRYCSGSEPFIHPVGGAVYWPRGMKFAKAVPADNPSRVTYPLVIDAGPAEGEDQGPFAAYLADNTLQGSELTIDHFIWSDDGWGSAPVASVTWFIERAGGASGMGGDHRAVKLSLSAYIGFRPGKGLSRGETGCDLLNGDGVMCFAAASCDHTWSTCQDTDAFTGNRWAIEDQQPIVIGGTPIEPGGPARPPIRQWRWVHSGQGGQPSGPCKLAPTAYAK